MALNPSRRHGKLRVASLLAAAAEVIAERGYEAATMAEIAARAGAHVGSLYHFFPNKEVLADALLRRYGEILDAAFAKIEDRVRTVSIGELADTLIGLLVELHSESKAIVALLEAGTAKREELGDTVLSRIAGLLRLRVPQLPTETAEGMAVVLLNNMRTMKTWTIEPDSFFRPGALSELREMNRLYLEEKLSN
ncbi:MAG TPA: helix-turn-helix domain-containing protein [Planctomycetaceae bacterium]|nr:helix-turn-helix domain-containing protein [Planctomycetaceae bacterium]